MKATYFYKEPDLIKTPYLNLFLKKYNTTYTNSYALSQRMEKENKILDLEQKEVVVFYDPLKTPVEDIVTQLTSIRTEILSTVKTILSQSKITLATKEDLLKHNNEAKNKSF